MNYPDEYWATKVDGYKNQDWVKVLSPFGKLLSSELDKDSHILELGCGAGQDSLGLAELGHKLVSSDGISSSFKEIEDKARGKDLDLCCVEFDLFDEFPFADNSFDAVYAQLVLHYFDDNEMSKIMKEIERVLKPGGLLAVMVNTIEDPEFNELDTHNNSVDMKTNGKIVKRYFSVRSLSVFVSNFDKIVFDDKGRTAKDDALGVGSLIRFIGKLK